MARLVQFVRRLISADSEPRALCPCPRYVRGRKLFALLMLLGAACQLGCTSAQPPQHAPSTAPVSDTDRIVSAWRAAQGTDQLQKVREIRAHVEGSWSRLAIAFDPVLTDSKFRQSSDERYQIRRATTEQAYRGPGGVKHVIRDDQAIHVSYNDRETLDSNVKDAAALVADCYRMFILGPLFFDERHGQFRFLGEQRISGAECDDFPSNSSPDWATAQATALNFRLIGCGISSSGFECLRQAGQARGERPALSIFKTP